MTVRAEGISSVFVRDRFTWLAYGMLMLFGHLQAAPGPIMPFLRDELNLSYTMGGMHMTTFAAGSVAAGLLVDRITQRFGRSVMLWSGGIGMVLGSLLFAASPVVALTLASTLVMGFFGAQILITVNASLSDHHGTQRTIALAEVNIAASLGAMIAPLLIGSLSSLAMNWRSALVFAVLLLVLLTFFFRQEPVPGNQAATVQTGMAHAPLPPIFWLYWVVIFLAVAIEWCLIIWSADFLETAVGLARSDAATLVVVFLLAMFVGRITGSRLARVLPTTTLLLAAVVIVAVGFPLFWLSPFALLNIAGLFIAGLGVANLFPLTCAASLGTVPDRTDIASARSAVAGACAILVAPLALGQVADQLGINTAFSVVAVGILLMLGMVICAAWQERT